MSSSLNIFSLFLSYFNRATIFLLSFWWVYLPFFLLAVLRDVWVKYKRNQFIQKMEWVLLEIIPPKEIAKTPKAMEQVFVGLHGIQVNPDSYNVKFLGKTQPWYSFEMVSLGGNLHFFIRCLAAHRDLVEANIYSQYQETEIRQVDDDYVKNIPKDVPNERLDIWGTEMVLTKDQAYPILTYPSFDRDITKEEQRIDPLAGLLEVMSKINGEEQIWIQMLVRPVRDSWDVGSVKHGWKPEAEKVYNELLGRDTKAAKPSSGFLNAVATEAGKWLEDFVQVLLHLITGQAPPDAAAQKAAEKKEQETPFLWKSTKQEQLLVSLIEEKTQKLGYDTILRCMYMYPTGSIRVGNINGMLGAFKQFGGQHINGLKPNSKVVTYIEYAHQGKKIKEAYRKRRILSDYRKRDLVQYSKAVSYLQSPFLFERLPIFRWFFIRNKSFVLNVEELASLYHFPGQVVKAPTSPKVEAKTGEPPASLPVG